LLKQYEDFKVAVTSTTKALALSTDAWHLIDWVFNEFKAIHLMSDLGVFRETLYPQCTSLKIMHDIANGAKHSKISKPKASIKETRKHIGPFSSVFSREFDQTSLEIELEDGTILHFVDEIEAVINFWIDYFRNNLKVI